MCGVVGLEGVCLFVLLFVVLSFFRLVWPPSVLPYNRRQYGMRRSSSLLIAILYVRHQSSALTEETCRQTFFFLRAQCTRLHKEGSSAIVPSFLRSFVPSFLRSFVLSFLRSFVASFLLRSFVRY